MLTADEIRQISFEKTAFGGYRPENVNNFIQEVIASYEQMQHENVELNKKLNILAQKLEEYRNQEDNIGSVLLNAQKFADSIYREAQHKADLIIKDAKIKGERIIASAGREIEREAQKLRKMQEEVSKFRSKLLSIYKEHIELISMLPTLEEEQEQPETPEEHEASQQAQSEPQKDTQPENAKQDADESTNQPENTVDNRENAKETDDEDNKSVKVSRFKEIKFGDDYDINEDD